MSTTTTPPEPSAPSARPDTRPRWLYEAKDREGRPTQGFVHATTAQEALQAISALQPPLSDIHLHSTGLHVRAMTEMLDDALGPLDAKALRAIARNQIELLKPPSPWRSLRQLLRNNRSWLLVCMALLALAVWRDWGVVVITCVAAAALFPFAWFLYMNRFDRMYKDVLNAFAKGDRQQLKALATRLEQLAQRHRFLRQPAWDAAVRVAWYHARAKGAEAATQRLSIHPLRPEDESEFLFRTYTLPLATGDRAGFIARLRALMEQRPNEPVLQVDLALGEARHGNTAEATRLLDTLQMELLPPYAQSYIDWVRGIIALHDPARLAEAVQHLSQASEQFLDLVQQSPAVWSSLAVCTSDYALALAWSGRHDEARDVFEGVLPVAQHHVEPQRLAMLERELRLNPA